MLLIGVGWVLILVLRGLSIIIRFPLPIGGILLVIAIVSSFIVVVSLNTVWYAYIFFMIIVGGVLVLFLYIAAISPRDGDVRQRGAGFGALLALWVGYNFRGVEIVWLSRGAIDNSMGNMYTNPLYLIVIYFAMYLLLVLLVVVGVVNKESGPLRVD